MGDEADAPSPPRQGGARPPGTRPIRSILAALLVVPLLSLTVLWAYETGVAASQAASRHGYDIQDSLTAQPGQALIGQLAAERLQSYVLLSGTPSASRAPLIRQRARTDAAVAAFRRRAAGVQREGALGAAAQRNLTALLTQLGQLGAIRAMTGSGQAGPLLVFQAYNTVIDAAFTFLGSQDTAATVSVYQQAAAGLDTARALEAARREDTLARGAFAAEGRMNSAQRALFGQIVGSQRLLAAQAEAGLSPGLAAPLRRLLSGAADGSFRAMESKVMTARPDTLMPMTAGAWAAASKPFLAGLSGAAAAEQAAVSASVRQEDNRTLLRLALTGGLGLLAVVASLLLLLRFGRRLARELTSLQRAARQVAGERLPQVVAELRRGEEVDPATRTEPIAQGRTTEIALVAQALSTVARTAVESTVGEARLRQGVSRVFLNLSRRHQSLLHRQLAMLDTMERETSDPDALAGLFRLDHLTTRMRRHAEGLIILSGATPARGWREPVPVIDVIRAAVAEVEDYVRVDVVAEAGGAVAGTAAADTAHLLAELIENATMFSPSVTRVEVRASQVGNGLAIEVEDRGIGIPPEPLAELNQRLGSPPEFDLADTDQLGLFVVGRLAARHGIRVALRESPYGGVTAIALLPHGLVAAQDGAQPAAAQGHPGGAGQPLVPQQQPTPGLTGRWQVPSAPPEAPPAAGPAWAPGPLPVSLPAAAGDGAGATDAVPAALRAAAGAAAGAGAAPDAAGEWRGLPRRVRQASLAPQLRDDPAGAAPPETGAATLRSPGEAQAMMAALQQGWQRGREEDGPVAGPPAAAVDGATPAADGEEGP